MLRSAEDDRESGDLPYEILVSEAQRAQNGCLLTGMAFCRAYLDVRRTVRLVLYFFTL